MRPLIAMLVFNTPIAGFLTALGFGGGFAINRVFSQCAGLTIMVLIQLVLRLPLRGAMRGADVGGAIVAGALVGGMLGRQLTGLGVNGSHEASALIETDAKLTGGDVTISARRQSDGLRIVVTDDGLGFGETSGVGIGVGNVPDRLDALYGPTARLELNSKVGAGVTATMSIPVGIPA